MTPAQLQEISKCKRDFVYFCQKYLKIINKKNKLCPLILNRAQRKLLKTLGVNKFMKVLKARQLGSSTFIAAFFFWRTLFNLNEKTVVIAHQHESVKSIFRIYKCFYDSLPGFMQFKTVQSSANALEFETGSLIHIGSASSEAFRGTSAISNLHLSEVAFWPDMKSTISSVFQATSETPYIILETTANSINEFYHFWTDENGYEPVFLAWNDDDNNVLSKLSETSTRLMEEKTEIVDYLANKGYSDDQMRWAIDTFFMKTAGDMVRFKQEYASDDVTCFITSGDKFFSETFIVKAEVVTGYIRYEEPTVGKIYSIGVDTAAGGVTGDYSTFMVLDITNKIYPKIVATYYERAPLLVFAQRVLEECLFYKAYAVVEKNSYGLTVIEHLVSQQYSFVYTKTVFDKVANVFKDEYGFYTSASTRPLLLSKVQDFVNNKKMVVIDSRLQQEINSFIYKNGRPEAAPNAHDDLVMATALALMAIEQYDFIDANRERPNPRSGHEWLELELRLGMPKEAIIRSGIVRGSGGSRITLSPLPNF